LSNIQEIRRGSTASLDRVDGDLKIGNKARIQASNKKFVVVSGDAYFEGAAEISCSFECDSLIVKHGGTLKVRGDLIVHKLLDIAHSIGATGSIKAGEIDVGGMILSKSIQCDGLIRIGGWLKVKETLEAKSLDVGGQASVGGMVKLQDLSVGGVAEVGGGIISGKISVGGRFASNSPLEFGDIQVYGRIDLQSKSKGKKISTYGRLSAEADLDCDELELKGRTDIQGNCKSEKIESSGKFNVSGSLDASGEVETWGQTKIAGEFRCNDLRIGGSFNALRAIVGNEIELVGNAETKDGMKGNVITVRSGSKYKGVLIGNTVAIGKSNDVVSNWGTKFAGQSIVIRLVGKETSVGDVYAKEVHLGRAARCGKIFAEVVEFEEGLVADEVAYTKEIRGPIEKTFLNRPFPKKVAELPNPPL
jgi:cytoskeletal protein CcmA (bactofilin family)